MPEIIRPYGDGTANWDGDPDPEELHPSEETWQGKPLPEIGRKIHICEISRWRGMALVPDPDYYAGAVLWAHVERREGRDGDEIEMLRIQLHTGRVATLSTEHFGDSWRYLSEAELADADAALALVDHLEAQAEQVRTSLLRRQLRTQAAELRERAGEAMLPPQWAPYGPQRPTLRWLLAQDREWWTAVGARVLLDEMGPRHKRNLLAMLRRKSPRYHLSYSMSPVFANAPDEVIDDLERQDPVEWINEQPLVRRLVALIAADEAAGVPDEPPPTPEELERYQVAIGQHGRDSQQTERMGRG